MAKVFLSHSTHDRHFLETEIIPTLRQHGVEVWYSKQDIHGATEWAGRIVAGLEECDWFLVIMSPRSAASEWVRDEVHWAMENRRGKIIPVLMEDCQHLQIHIRLQRLQFVDYRSEPDMARRELIRPWCAADTAPGPVLAPHSAPPRSDDPVELIPITRARRQTPVAPPTRQAKTATRTRPAHPPQDTGAVRGVARLFAVVHLTLGLCAPVALPIVLYMMGSPQIFPTKHSDMHPHIPSWAIPCSLVLSVGQIASALALLRKARWGRWFTVAHAYANLAVLALYYLAGLLFVTKTESAEYAIPLIALLVSSLWPILTLDVIRRS